MQNKIDIEQMIKNAMQKMKTKIEMICMYAIVMQFTPHEDEEKVHADNKHFRELVEVVMEEAYMRGLNDAFEIRRQHDSQEE